MKHRDLRLELNNHVELFWNGSKMPADIENISVGGALVSANLPVMIGDSMSIHLEDSSLPVDMEMGGEVIRKGHMRHGMPAFALKFGTVPETLQIFMHYLMVTHKATAV
jgi:hypothetical protein